jgi:hypothetical protein
MPGARVFDGPAQVEAFGGDYGVTHRVRRGAIRHVFSAAEIPEAMRPQRAGGDAWCRDERPARS